MCVTRLLFMLQIDIINERLVTFEILIEGLARIIDRYSHILLGVHMLCNKVVS